MHRRAFLQKATTPFLATAATRARPNILLIYTDQQRYDTIHALGCKHAITPAMDRLVREGVTFTQATTPSPVCMAARWSLQTGQWTSTHRCYSNHHPGTLPPTHLPGMLRKAGYRTGLSGKNHTYLTQSDFDFFDENPGPRNSEAGKAWSESWSKLRKQNPRLAEQALAGGSAGDPMRAVTERAVDFLDQADSKPFFLFASYLYPHTPYHLPQPFFDRWTNREIPEPPLERQGLKAAGKPFRHQFHQRNNDAILPFNAALTKQMRQVYHGMIELVDSEIGALLRHLDDRRLGENTLVVFTSDHGDYMGDHGLYTKSPAMYDCLTRVPFLVRWPDRIRKPRRDPAFVSHVDLMPTFASAAGIEPPRQAQGRDILSGFRREAAFSEYGVPGTPYDDQKLIAEGLQGKRFSNPGEARLPWEGNPVSLAGRFRMLRTERWKYVHEPGGTDELYDLEHDPNELANVAHNPSHRGTIRDLKAKLERLTAEATKS